MICGDESIGYHVDDPLCCYVAKSTFVALSASEIALNETLSRAPSISRKNPRTYPFLAILRSMV